ncbi:MAG: enoyl-CoA hydratase/isomerase family protein [Alphaproteobacteria bacterium]|nr:enoyl-CoA hydratase/isomerase family protein [Alphaproteobacteria bacterium]
MAYSQITYEADKADKFAVLTLNRPEKLNALGSVLMDEIGDAVARAGREQKALVITGTGRAFSTGFDLEAGNYEMGIEAWREDVLGNMRRLYALWSAPIATVAAVNGYCLAGGMELMLCCDLAIAATDARIGEPEIRHASAPPTLMMPWTAPIRHVRHLMFTGDMISGEEAARMHIVNKAVPPERLMDEACALARKLSRIPHPGIKFNKLAINNAQLASGMYNAWLYNAETTAQLHATPEGGNWFRLLFQKGLKAFLAAREGPFKEFEKR